MSRAHISTWYNYSASLETNYYQLFYQHFVDNFHKWCDLVDTIYIIDVNWNFTDVDKKRITDIKKEVVFYKSPIIGPHCIQYQHFLPQIKEEQMLFMDNDCFILDRIGISQWFDVLKDNDAVIKMDNHGGLSKPIKAKYPMANGNDCFDMAHFLITRKFLNSLEKIDFNSYQPFPKGIYIKELDYYTQEGDWCEMFALLFYQMLERKNTMVFSKLDGLEHIRGGSYIYLLPSYKVNAMPQYWDYIQKQPKKHTQKLIEWFVKLSGDYKLGYEMMEDLYE